jgi:NADH:ubiquinone oxidoreductase subunit 4 (subunit M)
MRSFLFAPTCLRTGISGVIEPPYSLLVVLGAVVEGNMRKERRQRKFVLAIVVVNSSSNIAFTSFTNLLFYVIGPPL